jgi:putative addiction module antidote
LSRISFWELDARLCCHYSYNMAIKTKIRKIGNSYGIVLPKEALHVLKVKEGDAVYLTDSPGCALRMTSGSDTTSDMLKIAERGMSKYRNALRELAK